MNDLIKLARCGDCAFTPGTEANLFCLTPAKAEMCAMIGEPFWCHVGKERRLCAGWVERVVTSEVAPKDCPPWKRRMAEATLEFIESIEDRHAAGKLPSEEDLMAEHMRMLLAALAESDLV